MPRKAPVNRSTLRVESSPSDTLSPTANPTAPQASAADFGPAPITPAFRNALEDLRDQLNSKVRLRLKQGDKLDTLDLQRHLRERVAPIVDAVHACLPERTRVVTSDLFDVSLELFAAGQLGPSSKSTSMDRLWRSVLPKLAMLVARDPRRVVGSLSNAVLVVEQHHNDIAARWLEKLETVGILADSSEQLLAMGKLAAWTSGMAHWRPTALALAETLPWAIAGELSDLPTGFSAADVSRFVQRAASNPWEDGLQSKHNDGGEIGGPIKPVKRCGAFRGFGGSMLAPPRVALRDGKLFLTDQTNVWQLIADHFGWIQQRVDLLPEKLIASASKAKLHSGQPQVDQLGTIRWEQQQLLVPELAQPTSFACDGSTLAVTIATSFHLFLFARGRA